MTMFRSLKKWLKTPLVIVPFVRYDGTGSAIYDEDSKIDTKCYAQGSVKMIRDADGNEVVSDLQLYINGSVDISLRDLLIFDEEEYDVKAVAPFYDGSTGKVDIKVVYL